MSTQFSEHTDSLRYKKREYYNTTYSVIILSTLNNQMPVRSWTLHAEIQYLDEENVATLIRNKQGKTIFSKLLGALSSFLVLSPYFFPFFFFFTGYPPIMSVFNFFSYFILGSSCITFSFLFFSTFPGISVSSSIFFFMHTQLHWISLLIFHTRH